MVVGTPLKVKLPFVPKCILSDFIIFFSIWEITVSLNVKQKKPQKPAS